jgi:putative nucleotidyltransferase-like protein
VTVFAVSIDMPGTSTALDREWSVLLAACSAIPLQDKLLLLEPLLQQPIRWNVLFELADRHGTQPLLCQALTGLGPAVPAKEMLALKQAYQTNLHKSLLLSRELIRIVDCVTVLNLDVMPYKGPALAEVLYGDIALRKSGDIDLLIRAQDLAGVRDAVRDLGYIPHMSLSAAQERAYVKSGYEYAFDGAAGPNLLELQWAIQPRFYAVDFDMDGVFQRAVTITVVGRPMRTPALDDLFLVLSLHAAKHVWGRLVWLCDIARLMSCSDMNWERVGAQARELGIVRILRVTMLLTNRLLGAAIPAAAERSLPPEREAAALAEEVQMYVLSETTFNVESLSYFRLMMRLRELGADRRRFLRRLVLTPGLGEWNAIPLPPVLFPLYRLVRIARLAARVVRR